MNKQIDDPQFRARQAVVEYWNENTTLDQEVSSLGVVTVWFCYILGGWKCLMFINSQSDNYFEVTYNVAKGEMYLDHYTKVFNKAIPDSVDYRIAKVRNKLSK